MFNNILYIHQMNRNDHGHCCGYYYYCYYYFILQRYLSDAKLPQKITVWTFACLCTNTSLFFCTVGRIVL